MLLLWLWLWLWLLLYGVCMLTTRTHPFSPSDVITVLRGYGSVRKRELVVAHLRRTGMVSEQSSVLYGKVLNFIFMRMTRPHPTFSFGRRHSRGGRQKTTWTSCRTI